MKFPALTSFIIFVLITQFVIRRTTRKEKENDEAFWDRERRSNSVRKQDLSGLDYISIPIDELPFGVLPDDPEVSSLEEQIKRLYEGQDNEASRICNFTGLTNTDLKLQYGAPNITKLSAYDQNYTTMVTTLQAWAKKLYDSSLYADAEKVLSFAVSTGTDITASYRMLCELYEDHLGLSAGEASERIKALLATAESLKSLSRDGILRHLNERLEKNTQIFAGPPPIETT